MEEDWDLVTERGEFGVDQGRGVREVVSLCFSYVVFVGRYCRFEHCGRPLFCLFCLSVSFPLHGWQEMAWRDAKPWVESFSFKRVGRAYLHVSCL